VNASRPSSSRNKQSPTNAAFSQPISNPPASFDSNTVHPMGVNRHHTATHPKGGGSFASHRANLAGASSNGLAPGVTTPPYPSPLGSPRADDLFRIQSVTGDSVTPPSVSGAQPMSSAGPLTPPLQTPPPTTAEPGGNLESSSSSLHQAVGQLTVNLPGATIVHPYATASSTATSNSSAAPSPNTSASTMATSASYGGRSVTVGDSSTAPATTTSSSTGNKADHPYRSFRVTMEDPCWKVLPAALKKYRVCFVVIRK
jgi:hypothetical protein